MNEHPDDDENFFFKLGHSLGCTRSGQFVISLTIAAFFSGLAYVAWNARDLAVNVLILWLLVYGFSLAWRFLPISSATHARWDREEEMLKRCPAYPFRRLFWVGSAIAFMMLLGSDPTKPIDHFDFLMPGIFIVTGTVSYILCQRFLRQEPNT